MNKVSVILPTYNEKDNISPLILGIQSQLNNQEYEITVVDDDSPDGTWRIVQELKKNDEKINLIRRRGRSGLTSAISEGIDSSSGDIIVWMDADLSMPPEKIKDLLERVNDGYDLSVASRYVPGGGIVLIEKSQDSFLSAILSFVMNFVIQHLLDSSFKDYTSGFIAVKKEVLENIKLRGDYGEYFIDFVYRSMKKGYKVTEVPYICGARQYGISKTGSNLLQYVKRGQKYIWTAVRLKLTKGR
jgi:dolichol-phosphate mannosyltransferase|tara:strand:+ start:314 stop:1045 length:732 start_codon:yes stop_codon:yes gene_type:complete